MSPNQLQNHPGVRKPTQQRHGSSYIARHIHFDRPTEFTLRNALEVLSGVDRVSIALVVRRAVALYGASLQQANPDRIEEEREAVRKGARVAKQSSGTSRASSAV